MTVDPQRLHVVVWLPSAEVKVIGEEKVEGKDCYKVEAVTPEKETIISYYDKNSGLLLKLITPVETPQGKITTTSVVSDYKKVDGVLMPFKMVTRILTQEVAIEFTSHEANVKIPMNRFQVPADVKKLAEKSGAEKN